MLFLMIVLFTTFFRYFFSFCWEWPLLPRTEPRWLTCEQQIRRRRSPFCERFWRKQRDPAAVDAIGQARNGSRFDASRRKLLGWDRTGCDGRGSRRYDGWWSAEQLCPEASLPIPRHLGQIQRCSRTQSIIAAVSTEFHFAPSPV